MDDHLRTAFRRRGFLPAEDPDSRLTLGERFEIIDQIGNDLPSLLLEPEFRSYMRAQVLPEWPHPNIPPKLLSQAHLYYLRLGFIASGYINQIGQPVTHSLPANIARPLCQIAELLERPPMLSYDGYALYNWKRFDPDRGIELGNIDTVQNFVHLYDEHWFILIHVEIEALAARMMDAMMTLDDSAGVDDHDAVDNSLLQISAALDNVLQVLRRIPEKMSDELYFSRFRPYIGQFRDVTYESMGQVVNFRGETGAQSSMMPMLVEFMKIPHQPNRLISHLNDMRHYMPKAHVEWLDVVHAMPDVRPVATPETFNRVLEQMAEFREVHYHWAIKYIARRCNDQHGTGGTPYLKWLKYLIDETRQHQVQG
ncbi:hypothetical protein IOQ59_15690 [Pontibacterium sp. N1Y112]|uniref:Indoleamine 2,3-dioxygenase n=1 Tax=Pontibacterium sinense TaxID=2781979 RepID=A0A8J7KB23_9GAMM|nr:hypothetical protein [Pontibacterium sinense]MBE9398701.1 hypothetical protein [Pontibacterium sinense]